MLVPGSGWKGEEALENYYHVLAPFLGQGRVGVTRLSSQAAPARFSRQLGQWRGPQALGHGQGRSGTPNLCHIPCSVCPGKWRCWVGWEELAPPSELPRPPCPAPPHSLRPLASSRPVSGWLAAVAPHPAGPDLAPVVASP